MLELFLLGSALAASGPAAAMDGFGGGHIGGLAAAAMGISPVRSLR